MPIINDAIALKRVAVDDKGTRQDRIYVSFRSDYGHVGSFFVQTPEGISELKEKSVRWGLGTIHSPVDIDNFLLGIFSQYRQLSSMISKYNFSLKILADDNTRTRNKIAQTIDDAISGNILLPEEISDAHDLLELRKEILGKKQLLDDLLREKAMGYCLINDELGRLDIHLNALNAFRGGFSLNGIRKLDGKSNIENLVTAHCDTETKYFKSSHAVPDWFVAEARRKWSGSSRFSDSEIKKRAKAEFDARRKTMTHIALLYRQQDFYQGEIHTIHNTGLDEITGSIDGINAVFTIKSHEIGKSEVDEKYNEFVHALGKAGLASAEKVYKKFGVIYRGNNTQERIMQDIKSHIEEMRMRDSAQMSAKEASPFCWVYHYAPYDIEEKKNIPTGRQKDRSWTIDHLSQPPRKVAHVRFMEKERISDAVILDTLDIAKNFYPEIGTKKLDSFIQHLHGSGSLQVLINDRIQTIRISEHGPKSITHADINPLNLLADYGDMNARRKMLYYQAGDVLLTAWIERHPDIAEARKAVLNVQSATSLSLNDLLHSTRAIAEYPDMIRFLNYHFLPNSFRSWRRKLQMANMAREFGSYIEPKIPDVLKADSNEETATAVYVPYAFFAKDIIDTRKMPGLQEILDKFTLHGNQRAQLVYERFMEVLTKEMFFDRFTLSRMNREYAGDEKKNFGLLGRIPMARKEFESFSEGLKTSEYQEAINQHQKAYHNLVHAAEFLYDLVNIKSKSKSLEEDTKKKVEEIKEKLHKAKRLPRHDDARANLFAENYLWLDIAHPQVYAAKSQDFDFSFDESLKAAYGSYKNAQEKYHKMIARQGDTLEKAFSPVTKEWGGNLEDLLYLNALRLDLQSLAIMFNWRYMNFVDFRNLMGERFKETVDFLKQQDLKVTDTRGHVLYLKQVNNHQRKAIEDSQNLIYLGDVSTAAAHPRRAKKDLIAS